MLPPVHFGRLNAHARGTIADDIAFVRERLECWRKRSRESTMSHSKLASLSVLVVIAVSGCSSAKMTSSTVSKYQFARPEHVVVYDLAGTAADIAADPTLGVTDAAMSPQPTEEEIATGRELGALVAAELVKEIQAMGLNAVHASEHYPEPGDLVLKGYFQSMEKGSAVKRIALGFGSGAADIQTVVKGYEMTTQGLVERGSAEFDSGGGNKGPGMIVPIAVVVATANPIGLAVGGAVQAGREIKGSNKLEGAAKRTAKAVGEELRARFERQGWIAASS
jgi:hypothetical protein